MKKYIRKLGRTSKYTYLVTLPKEIVQKYGWQEKQKLTLTDKGRGLVEIRDWRRK
jgi:bifunctional DNA-binding transcriptional regulator/antitoxin component of YhaV-PrlF toxin-antitoxin module